MAGTDRELDVLVIGLDPYRVPGPWDPEPVAAAIESGMAALAARGFRAESCLLGLDGSDDIGARVVASLRARRWRCVLVGGGLRTDQDRVELFELVVNLVHHHAPQAAIAFNSRPDDLAGAVTRALRTAQESQSPLGGR